MIGVLLAGGSAVRLPNKVLLPVEAGCGGTMPLFLSGYDYLVAQGCDPIVLLDQSDEDSLIAPIIAAQQLLPVVRIVDDHKGILNALHMVASQFPAEQEFLVCCGDNVYDQEEELPDLPRFAVVRRAPAELNELDWYDEHWDRKSHFCPWTCREAVRGNKPALTTPWKFQRKDFPLFPLTYECGMVQWFNSIQLPMVEMPAEGWSDLGTRASYKAYWNSLAAKL